MTIKNIKYNLYQKLGTIFPAFFKNRAFASLKEMLDPASAVKPSESELYILHLFVDSNSVIADVGANNGLYCYYFQEITKCKEIYAFEPIPSLYSKLKRWFRHIHIFPYAISNENGEKVLKIPYINSVKYETRAKLDNLVETGENHYDEIAIQAKTLDSVFLPLDLEVGFIKIDIEGHEWAAIEGAKQIISRDHPTLMVEIEARHHGDAFSSVIRSITELGYECFFFDRQNLRLEPFSNFVLEKHQNISNPVYINNFLFFPMGSFSIDTLNSRIKQIFNS